MNHVRVPLIVGSTPPEPSALQGLLLNGDVSEGDTLYSGFEFQAASGEALFKALPSPRALNSGPMLSPDLRHSASDTVNDEYVPADPAVGSAGNSLRQLHNGRAASKLQYAMREDGMPHFSPWPHLALQPRTSQQGPGPDFNDVASALHYETDGGDDTHSLAPMGEDEGI